MLVAGEKKLRGTENQFNLFPQVILLIRVALYMYMQAHSIGGRGRGQGGPSLPPLFLAGIFFLKFTYKRPISLK